MRRGCILLLAVVLLAAPAAAQQASAQKGLAQPSTSQTLAPGSLQIVAASQATTGDPSRTGGLEAFTPDVGLTWFRPTLTWGTITVDAHAVRAENDPRLGRALFSIKNMKRGGLTWNLSAGDSAYTPYLADYGFNNLFAPQVTFRGGAVTAKSDNSSLSVTAGRVTVYRDLFGADADMLGQSLFVARASQKITKRVEVVGHASRVRTEDLKGYNYLIESGDDAGAGVRVNITRTLQFIGDAGITSYRRKGAADWEKMPSLLVGTRWTGKSGWLQIDAHRFSPGSFSVVNNPYADREGLFAAGEYEFAKRVRVSGGWDMFRNNRQAEVDDGRNTATSSRAYGGARARINSHLSVGTRMEEGARVSQPSRYSVGYESDTGAKSVDAQISFKRWNAIGRYEYRSNVDISDALAGSSAGRSTFAQRDMSGQMFFNVTQSTRIFGSLFRTERRGNDGGQSFWQASLGTQFQAGRRLTAHGEVIASRNRDMQSDFLTPRSAFNGGLSAQLAKHVALSVNVYIDRSPVQMIKRTPWMSRTMVRLVYTVPTGSATSALSPVPGAPKLARGTETIEGTVFVDWNGNGSREADEETVGGVRLILDNRMRVTADDKGRFRFDHIVAGEHLITLDVPTVPADFDPPALTGVDMNLRHSEIPKVGFGLVPLGDIEGVVLLDANGNAAFDENDQPVDGAVLVLDDGSRTEVARNGMFRFSGVRTGTHTVQLLLESLPDDASVLGERQAEIRVSRDQRAPVLGFLLKAERRPEIRKIFVPKKNNNNNNDSGTGSRLDRNDSGTTKSRSGASRSSYSKSRSNSKSSESKSSK